ncbi:MEF2-activating motif and SAP domain-containing transcriptional regulator [Pantherophis guttatus]|uniref:MEF2-activating motif and SAP domain-containing transcriptional regulator n=1 Tax=Pantherophis guttatus TaxID=94885 RepID=A0A6P9C762_PANGU|nr:MEF2-activating motif and SAP domain-containing transcriptional regulator [Pantherophis guttatus]XP_034275416.1 MEF2-activating motif and SAP domain-containing transcriptional regulator [Pantherophis guttatus]
MTLLASEQSMLIRRRFRSVLQMRMQHRRSQEQLSERHLIPGLSKSLSTFSQPSGTQGQTRANETAKLKVSPRPHKTSSTKSQMAEVSRGDRSELQEKKARLAEDLSEKILHRPGPLELVKKNILPLDPGITDVVADAARCRTPESFNFEEDLSSSSSSSSPCFALSPGSGQGNPSTSEAVFQLDLPPVLVDQQPAVTSSTSDAEFSLQGGNLLKPTISLPKALHKVPEARKAPRPKKAKEPRPKVKKLKYHQYMPPDQKGEQAPLPMDAAYAHLLQQQQVFLQLQILNQQQQPMPTSPATFCVQALHAVPASNAPEQLLNFPGTPAPTSGPPTLPLPSPATPISPLPPKPELLPANLEELTVSELRQQLRKRGLPVSGTKPALLERLKPYQVARVKPPPVPLPSARLAPSELEEEPQALQEKQRVVENLALKLHRELKHRDGDPREELELHKQIKNRRKGALQSPGQQEAPPPPYIPKRECAKEGGGTEDRFMVLCPTSCEPIHSDMELPLEITASPPDPAPATRSLEEELQEAIQKAQLVPSQSIEEILEEPLMCTGDILQAPALTPEVSDQVSLSPLVHQEASPPKKSCSSNEPPLVPSAIFDFPGPYDFLSTASSSSASLDSLSSVFSPDSLEMPPSPPDAWQGSGIRAGFDPVDWLEALTSGSASGLGSASPVGSSIFCTDFFDSSDLGVNHMIDLMVEQW